MEDAEILGLILDHIADPEAADPVSAVGGEDFRVPYPLVAQALDKE